jgi:hypothetical protein
VKRIIELNETEFAFLESYATACRELHVACRRHEKAQEKVEHVQRSQYDLSTVLDGNMANDGGLTVTFTLNGADVTEKLRLRMKVIDGEGQRFTRPEQDVWKSFARPTEQAPTSSQESLSVPVEPKQ